MVDIFQRSYGVEIECIGPVGFTHEQCAQAITNAGLPAQYVPYNQHHGRVSTKWKITTDGSITGNGVGYDRSFEIVSPILKGENGFADIARVCEVLQRRGFAVNQSCGLHVHVGIRNPDFPFPAMRRLAMMYVENERILDTIMPPSRKSGTFARPLASVSVEALGQCADFNDICDVFYGYRRGTTARNRMQPRDRDIRRFVKLNFTSYVTFGTVEFRHHAGTLIAGKITPWIMACLRMVDYAQNTTTADVAAQVARTVRIARSGTKRARVLDMLRRPEGCTSQEVVDATGPRHISVVRLARRYGFTVQQERVQNPNGGWTTRYFAPQAAPATAAPSVAVVGKPNNMDEFCVMLGMTDDERKYWKDRMTLFANATANVARR